MYAADEMNAAIAAPTRGPYMLITNPNNMGDPIPNHVKDMAKFAKRKKNPSL